MRLRNFNTMIYFQLFLTNEVKHIKKKVEEINAFSLETARNTMIKRSFIALTNLHVTG
jgi:hypothetical protein